MTKKIIKTKKPNRKSKKIENTNKKVLTSKQPLETIIKSPKNQPSHSTPINSKLNLLKTFACLTIILHFILYVITLYYENKIPLLTIGINNFINLLTGGNK